MAQRTGITVHGPEGAIEYPDATSAPVAPSGNLVILRARSRGFPEALDEIPPDRWTSRTPGISHDPDE